MTRYLHCTKCYDLDLTSCPCECHFYRDLTTNTEITDVVDFTTEK